MKKFFKTFLLTGVFGLLFGLFSSLFILFDDKLDIGLSSVIISFILLVILIFYLLRNEKRLCEKYDLYGGLGYNICLLINFIIFTFIFYATSLALFENGIIYYCEEDCGWNGLQLLYIMFLSFFGFIDYLFIRVMIFLVNKYKTSKKKSYLLSLIIPIILFIYLLLQFFFEFGFVG